MLALGDIEPVDGEYRSAVTYDLDVFKRNKRHRRERSPVGAVFPVRAVLHARYFVVTVLELSAGWDDVDGALSAEAGASEAASSVEDAVASSEAAWSSALASEVAESVAAEAAEAAADFSEGVNFDISTAYGRPSGISLIWMSADSL